MSKNGLVGLIFAVAGTAWLCAETFAPEAESADDVMEFSVSGIRFFDAEENAELAVADAETDAAILFLLYEFYAQAWGISVSDDPYGGLTLPNSWQIRKNHAMNFL